MTANTAGLPSQITLPYVAMSDAALVASVAHSDKVAMHVLYSRYSGRVFRFAMRLVNNRQAAEDVMIEVFLAVWREAERFESRSQVVTWLLAIARHKALSVRRQRQTEQLDEDAVALIEDLSDNQETAIQKRETLSIMRKCLAHLSPGHREVIDLVYYHGKSIDEVATTIGAVRSTVKTRIFYARKQLTRLLVAEGIDTSFA